jgi:YVTN family beta-propeller protein
MKLTSALISILTLAILGASCGGVKFKEEAASYRIYATNESSGDLTVIDSKNHDVIATVAVGKRPRGIRASRDGKLIYVALSGSPLSPPGTDPKTLPPPDRTQDGVAVVEAASNKVLRVIRCGEDPEQFDLSLDGNTLYVANEDVAKISVVDLRTDKVVASVAVGEEPEGVTVSPDGKFVYVTAEAEGAVFVIETATNKMIKSVKVGERPRSVMFLPDGSKAYVTVENDAVIAVLDGGTHELQRKIELGSPKELRPMGFALTKDAKRLFASMGRGGRVIAMDTATDAVNGTFYTKDRPWGIALSPDGSTLYTANGPSNEVTAIDVPSGKLTRRIQTGKRPWGIITLAPSIN